MALGTPFSNSVPENAVYRLLNPAQAGTPGTTHWYIGNGNPVVNNTHTYSQGGANPFPAGNFTTGISRFSTIKIGVGGVDDWRTANIDETFLTIYAAITDADDVTTPVNEAGMFLRVLKSSDGGKTWANTTAQPANYMGQQGEYDTAVAVDPRNANIAYLVGLSGVCCAPPTEAQAAPHRGRWSWNVPTSITMRLVDLEGRLVTGNDGGVRRWDPRRCRDQFNGGGLAITTLTDHQPPDQPRHHPGGSQDNGTGSSLKPGVGNTADPETAARSY